MSLITIASHRNESLKEETWHVDMLLLIYSSARSLASWNGHRKRYKTQREFRSVGIQQIGNIKRIHWSILLGGGGEGQTPASCLAIWRKRASWRKRSGTIRNGNLEFGRERCERETDRHYSSHQKFVRIRHFSAEMILSFSRSLSISWFSFFFPLFFLTASLVCFTFSLCLTYISFILSIYFFLSNFLLSF